MAQWSGQSRGTPLGYKIFIFIIKTFGLSFAYWLAKVVSLYFFLFLKDKKEVLRDFYLNRLGVKPEAVNKLIRKNFLIMGHGIVDKMAIALGKPGKLTYTNDGEHYLREMGASGEGGFLISAHIGNWDVAGFFLKNTGAPVNVMMYANEEERIKAFMEENGIVPNYKIIPIGEDFGHIIQTYAAVKNGELVCLHADRFLEGMDTIEVEFLGAPAKFPLGVFKMISKMRVPYTFTFAVKNSTYNYHYTATKPALPGKSAEEIARDFVKELEKKVRTYPEQWFNYYDFYST